MYPIYIKLHTKFQINPVVVEIFVTESFLLFLIEKIAKFCKQKVDNRQQLKLLTTYTPSIQNYTPNFRSTHGVGIEIFVTEIFSIIHNSEQ